MSEVKDEKNEVKDEKNEVKDEKTEEKKEKSKEKKSIIAILKETPQTLAEAKKKTIVTCILAGLVYAIVCVPFFIISPLFGVILLIPAPFLVAYLYYQYNQKSKRNFCPKCGAKFDYEKDISWNVTNSEEKSYTPQSNSNSKKIVEKTFETVCFDCRCAKCGEVTTFNKKFTTAVCYDDGSVQEKSVETQAKEYFKL